MTGQIIRQSFRKNLLRCCQYLLLTSCCSCEETHCHERTGEKLIQEYKTTRETIRLFIEDFGASGSAVTLRICNKAGNKTIEEIALRGDQYLPTVDSVIGNFVHIHYSYPSGTDSPHTTLLRFKDAVLGKALLGKVKLKYEYVFVAHYGIE